MITLSKTFFLDAILVISLLFVYSEKEKKNVKVQSTDRGLSKTFLCYVQKRKKQFSVKSQRFAYQLYFDVFRFDE